MKNKLLQWELDWIDDNSHLYVNQDIEKIKVRITLRYLLNMLD